MNFRELGEDLSIVLAQMAEATEEEERVVMGFTVLDIVHEIATYTYVQGEESMYHGTLRFLRDADVGDVADWLEECREAQKFQESMTYE